VITLFGVRPHLNPFRFIERAKYILGSIKSKLIFDMQKILRTLYACIFEPCVNVNQKVDHCGNEKVDHPKVVKSGCFFSSVTL
jgi:hypothetical protein